MIALGIVFAVLLALNITLVGADIQYIQNALTLKIKFGPFSAAILPKPENARKKPAGSKKPKKEKPPKKKTEEKGGGIVLKLALGMARPLLKALSRLRGGLRVELLFLHYVAASGDPCDAAVQYGYVNAAICGLSPLAERAVKIKKREISTELSFEADRPQLDIRLVAVIRVWVIIYIALALGVSFLRCLNEAKREPAGVGGNEERTDSDGKQ